MSRSFYAKLIASLAVFTLFSFLNLQTVFADYLSTTNIPASYENIGQPNGLAMAADGDIWFVDRLNFIISKYDPSTNEIVRTVGREGEGEGEFDAGIFDLAIDSDGFI